MVLSQLTLALTRFSANQEHGGPFLAGSYPWMSLYLLSSLAMRFDTGADRIVLWVTLAYAREYVIQHYAYAPMPKRIARELSRYTAFFW